MPDVWKATVFYAGLELGGDFPPELGRRRIQDFTGDQDGKDTAIAWLETQRENNWEIEYEGIELVIPIEQITLTRLEFIPEEE